jgi:hypothetical protein
VSRAACGGVCRPSCAAAAVCPLHNAQPNHPACLRVLLCTHSHAHTHTHTHTHTLTVAHAQHPQAHPPDGAQQEQAVLRGEESHRQLEATQPRTHAHAVGRRRYARVYGAGACYLLAARALGCVHRATHASRECLLSAAVLPLPARAPPVRSTTHARACAHPHAHHQKAHTSNTHTHTPQPQHYPELVPMPYDRLLAGAERADLWRVLVLHKVR